MSRFFTHLEGAWDGTRIAKGTLCNTHEGRPIVARYDLASLNKALSRDEVSRRLGGMWKYRELLPLAESNEPVSLGEAASPLLACPRLGKELGLEQMFIKDESILPTGSFKSRGMTVAISMAKELGVTKVALPTAGNAGGAAAAYAARAGIECHVFMPRDTPVINRREALLYGAHVTLVDGLIHDCGRIVRENAAKQGWFDLSTLKEPYRLEGKKTMGIELAEQCGWSLPDVILYPTGGGTGLVGMAKAFAELTELGWLKDNKRPRFYSCQSEGCAPIVRAFNQGERLAQTWENAQTCASGLRVPAAVGDFMMLDAIRASGGAAIAASEASIPGWMRKAASLEGVPLCPETAVCLEVLQNLVKAGTIHPEEKVVVFNTGAAQKYLECLEEPKG
jgi:threonine synthase